MLAAIITLSLISLLVATEADPSASPPEPGSGEPLRPSERKPETAPGNQPDRLAA